MKFLTNNTLSLICLALMFLVGIYLYPNLPDTVPMQYGIDGTAQNYLPKIAAIIVLPVAYAAAIAVSNVMIRYSPEKFSMANSKRAMDIIIAGVGLLLVGAHLGLLLSVGDTQVFQQYFAAGLALFLIVTGNVIGKTERNFIVGIRLPWTIASSNNWRATHRFTGKLMVISGLLLLAANFFSSSLTLTIVAGFAWALLSIGYSFLFYLRNERPTSE